MAAADSTLWTLPRARLLGYNSIEDAVASFASVRESVLPPQSSLLVNSPWEVNRPGVGDAFWQRVRHDPQFEQYHLPEFSSEDGETSALWQTRAQDLLEEWKDTFQRQTEGAEEPGGAPPLYQIHCKQAM